LVAISSSSSRGCVYWPESQRR